MPKYRIGLSVENASGTQWFTVEADSPQNAVDVYNKHGGEFEFEEIEVTELSKADVGCVELVEETE